MISNPVIRVLNFLNSNYLWTFLNYSCLTPMDPPIGYQCQIQCVETEFLEHEDLQYDRPFGIQFF